MRMCGYGRVSTDEEKQLDSLEHQIEFFNEFAKSRNYTLVHIYADEGISGKQLKNRDEFMRMMADAERDSFDVVVVKDVSRFARNTVDLLTQVRKLKSLGVEIIFVNNNQKTLGESEFVITLLGAMAQEESANLSKRVKFGKKITSKRGRVPPRIYGYNRIDNYTLEINEEESEVVRKIYDLYIDEGLGARLIALELERMGCKTKLGGNWNNRGIRRILENPIYCGEYINHKYAVTDFLEGKVQSLPEEEHFKHERLEWAIISRERYEEAQKILEQRSKQYANNYTHRAGRYSNRHALSTLIKCKECGRSFSRRVVTYKNTYVYWRCPTNNEYTACRCSNNSIVKEHELMQAIKEFVKGIVADQDEYLKLALAKYEASKQAERIDIDTITKKIDRLRKQKEKYTEMYANDIIDMGELKKKTVIITDQIKSIEADISRQSQRERSIADEFKWAVAKMEQFLSLEDITNVEMRNIIRLIEVNHDGDITIYFKTSDIIN